MWQLTSSLTLNLLLENLIVFLLITSFLGLTGFLWKNTPPFSIPQPLPKWFSVWLKLVVIIGIMVPVIAILVWGVSQRYTSVLQAFLPYLLMLGLQIASEIVTLKQFHSCIWVTIPCWYLPYRVWQLYTGLSLISPESELIWVQGLLWLEIILWIFNYGVHLSQLPRLLRWGVDISDNVSVAHSSSKS